MNSMNYSRRQLLTHGLGGLATLGAAAFLPGCQSGTTASGMPMTPWPDLSPRPSTRGNGYTPSSASTQAATPSASMPGVLARSTWASRGPIPSRINPMRGISRITIHHEGMPDMPFTTTDKDATRQRLEMVRNSHVNHRGWADIGYHFVVDRAGRVWEGRPLAYQGAHVKNENENNIGVMCLGNFEIQTPSAAQVTALENFVRDLRRRHRVAEARIYTHRELGSTSCPGRNLQPRINWLRQQHKFA